MELNKFLIEGRNKLKKVSGSSFFFEEKNYEETLPGLGWAGRGVTFRRNTEFIEKYRIKSNLIHSNFVPSLNTKLFNKNLSMPIMIAPMSGIKTNLRETINEKELLSKLLKVANSVGTYAFCGDSNDTTEDYFIPELLSHYEGIAMVKPRNDNEIKKRIELLIKTNPVAIGIDLDGLGGVKLFKTNAVETKNLYQLIKIRKLFSGPMILKGILSVKDAELAYKAGFDGIVVSNHGGRSADFLPSVAEVLPDIVKKFKNKMTIFADGGIKNGYDIFIYLALGADFVLVGRSSLFPSMSKGSEGLELFFKKLESELKKTMLFTNTKSLKEINLSKIYYND